MASQTPGRAKDGELQHFYPRTPGYVSNRAEYRENLAKTMAGVQAPVIYLSLGPRTGHVDREESSIEARGVERMTQMTESNKEKAGLGRALPLIAIAVVAAVGAVTLRDYLSFDTLRDNREALLVFRDGNYLLAVIGFIAVYIAVVGFSLPGASIATLTGGFLFGTIWGTLFNVTGATIGAILIFQAARMGLGERLKLRMEASQGVVAKIKKGLDENQWSMLFFTRLVPAVPFFVANLLPAFLGVPLHRFAISTFIGIIPGALVFTSIGAGLGEVFAKGETPDLGVIFEPHILFPLLGLTALSVLPVVIKAITGKKDLIK